MESPSDPWDSFTESNACSRQSVYFIQHSNNLSISIFRSPNDFLLVKDFSSIVIASIFSRMIFLTIWPIACLPFFGSLKYRSGSKNCGIWQPYGFDFLACGEMYHRRSAISWCSFAGSVANRFWKPLHY